MYRYPHYRPWRPTEDVDERVHMFSATALGGRGGVASPKLGQLYLRESHGAHFYGRLIGPQDQSEQEGLKKNLHTSDTRDQTRPSSPWPSALQKNIFRWNIGGMYDFNDEDENDGIAECDVHSLSRDQLHVQGVMCWHEDSWVRQRVQRFQQHRLFVSHDIFGALYLNFTFNVKSKGEDQTSKEQVMACQGIVFCTAVLPDHNFFRNSKFGFYDALNISGHWRRFQPWAWKVQQISLRGSNFDLRFFYAP